MIQHEYRYTIYLNFKWDNITYVIDPQRIKNVVIDSDYDNKNMPAILLNIVVDNNIADEIISNRDKARCVMSINKFIKDTEPRIEEKYISSEFMYYTTNTKNKTKEIDYDDDENKDITRRLIIALFKQELINNNKKSIINTKYTDISPIDVICAHTSHMPMLIEPMRDVKIPSIVIKPVESITKFIKQVDDNCNLYDTYYRLFYDIDRTYLLSGSGKAVYAKGDKEYSIILDVKNIDNNENFVQGMYIDDENGNYIINISRTDVNPNKDNVSNSLVDKFVGISTDGEVHQVDLSINNIADAITKTKIVRFDNNNTDNLKTVSSTIENRAAIINTIKTELDTSILTINREYRIRNYDETMDNSNFILIRKREVYVREVDEFVLSCVLTFAKVKS